MRINKEVSVNLLLLAALLLAGGWYFRDGIRRHFEPERPVPETTVVFSWRDSQGVQHFSEEGPGHHSKVMVVDTGRITPMEMPAQRPVSLADGGNAPASGKPLHPEQGSLRDSIASNISDEN